MKTLLPFAAVVLLGSLAGCATTDEDALYGDHRKNASDACEPGTGGVGQPPCNVVTWSSKDRHADPPDFGGKNKDD
ncbi:MAG: hypothetical protein QM761_14315 [Pseudoxanthomonas sp.]